MARKTTPKKAAAEVKAAETVVEGAIEAPVEEAPAPAEEKKTTAKKTTAAKKTTTAAKKTTAVEEEKKVYIQYNGGEISGAELVEKAKAQAKAEHNVKTAKKIDVYVKPEENTVYYVVNGYTGQFDLF